MNQLKAIAIIFSCCAVGFFTLFVVLSYPEHSIHARYWGSEDWLSLILRVISGFFIWISFIAIYFIYTLPSSEDMVSSDNEKQPTRKSA